MPGSVRPRPPLASIAFKSLLALAGKALLSRLGRSLPVWEQMLLPRGTMALARNATRVARAEMVGLVELHTQLQVRNGPPYTQFEHMVDRVIKRRDIVVAVKVL